MDDPIGFKAPNKRSLIKIKKDISSWLKISSLIYHTNESLDVYKILYVERVTRNREYNVLRLYQRYNRLRCNEELKDLESFLSEVPLIEEYKLHLKNQTKLFIFLDIIVSTKELYLKLLKAEYTTLRRPYMLRMLHGRFQKIRRNEEAQTLCEKRKVKKT